MNRRPQQQTVRDTEMAQGMDQAAATTTGLAGITSMI
jgi:hypothetical protein